MSKIIITIQPTAKSESWGVGYAAWANDKIIATHFCSNHSYAEFDLGKGRKQDYDRKFPEGYETRFSPIIRKPKAKDYEKKDKDE